MFSHIAAQIFDFSSIGSVIRLKLELGSNIFEKNGPLRFVPVGHPNHTQIISWHSLCVRCFHNVYRYFIDYQIVCI